MTTFTLQDLTPITTEENEAMQASAKLGGVDPLSEMFTQMGRDLASHELAHQQAQQARLDAPNPDAIQYTHGGTLGAPPPQPTCGQPVHNLSDIINTICTQLQLLATVITQQQANTTPPESNQSLQETISLTLQQADWFRTMVRHELVALDIEEIAKDAVESIVENEVESYFEHRFDCTDHFDFNDAVQDAVSDQIDDVVSDKMEDAVDSYLSNATIKIER